MAFKLLLKDAAVTAKPHTPIGLDNIVQLLVVAGLLDETQADRLMQLSGKKQAEVMQDFFVRGIEIKPLIKVETGGKSRGKTDMLAYIGGESRRRLKAFMSYVDEDDQVQPWAIGDYVTGSKYAFGKGSPLYLDMVELKATITTIPDTYVDKATGEEKPKRGGFVFDVPASGSAAAITLTVTFGQPGFHECMIVRTK